MADSKDMDMTLDIVNHDTSGRMTSVAFKIILRNT